MGGPEAAVRVLAASNPAFARFVANSRGKTPQQVCAENGVDFEAVRRIAGL